jgi:hypothetical protein
MIYKGCRQRITITNPEVCRLYWEIAQPRGNPDQIATRILRQHLIAMGKLQPKKEQNEERI